MTISWESLHAPEKLGGLGFGDIHLVNLRLLSKWWWKFANGQDHLSQKVVRSTDGFSLTLPSFDHNPKRLWKDI